MEEDRIANPCSLLLIGGSAGSLEVLIRVLPELLPPPFPIVVILHRRSSEDLALEELLAMKSPLPLEEVEDKTKLVKGHLYLAPADYHLLFEKNGLLSLDTSEKIHFSRPSIDVSFESAANAYAGELTAILLSGANNDGTKGLEAIQSLGGQTVAQDPASAEVDLMPKSAITAGYVDHVILADDLAEFINGLGSPHH